MLEKTLRECPFCGGKASVLRDIRSHSYFVACLNCGIETARIYHTKESAEKVWNRRV